MSNHNDWRTTLEFRVPDDEDGIWSEALLDAAVQVAPENVEGAVASGDLSQNRVWVTFTVVDTTEDEARRIAKELQGLIPDAAGLSDVASIDAACA